MKIFERYEGGQILGRDFAGLIVLFFLLTSSSREYFG